MSQSTPSPYRELPTHVPLDETVAVQEVDGSPDGTLAWAELINSLRYVDGGGGDGDGD